MLKGFTLVQDVSVVRNDKFIRLGWIKVQPFHNGVLDGVEVFVHRERLLQVTRGCRKNQFNHHLAAFDGEHGAIGESKLFKSFPLVQGVPIERDDELVRPWPGQVRAVSLRRV